ncbi:hypothetical protein JCM15457_160 [Liquorilactobacillus sucicola DSM 21376 = JCM 15457]|uniref:Uncharacterized protein n=1 Tax=Liquorilactobacillus sucicola DSM 21376 = JCM 15457 TaxID=1423806 RepID=A0A023CUP4_9LACO|nr:hypothetical protein [Liquorilactobacillus sucicola]KRN05241.1 hypothetical protein FD15_GL001787 [Liquorilactobacillus sucicola DSM 21376 = JCM 15457]GAJ25301.1 hypothetical protein JCM15457_160 [Liquorilactobacillus sucicola DSM 21376 = JCM 15457]
MARVIKPVTLLVDGKEVQGVYRGTDNEMIDESPNGSYYSGEGSLIIISNENHLEIANIKNMDGTSLLKEPSKFTLSKIDVRNAFKIDKILFDSIKDNIIQ